MDDSAPLTPLEAMVRAQIEARGVRDARVLAALRRIDRAWFVPATWRHAAYADHAIGLGAGQTISQPYIVAAMTEALELRPGARVLEIGTGSGYQCALLAELAAEVYSVERHPVLPPPAAEWLLRHPRVHLRTGDGTAGWPEAAPFDGIVATCACRALPAAWREQLAVGGTLVAPVGGSQGQRLLRVRRTAEGFTEEPLMAVRFVPLVAD